MKTRESFAVKTQNRGGTNLENRIRRHLLSAGLGKMQNIGKQNHNVVDRSGHTDFLGNRYNGSRNNDFKGIYIPKKRWHIDYFLTEPRVTILKILILPSIYKTECTVAGIISNYSDGCIKGFGSSDCRCPGHLFYFKPDNSVMKKILSS